MCECVSLQRCICLLISSSASSLSAAKRDKEIMYETVGCVSVCAHMYVCNIYVCVCVCGRNHTGVFTCFE